MAKMQRIKRKKHGPEWYIQRDLIVFLESRGWLVERMIGNAFQKGIPDLYCYHPEWGERWIDVKNPGKYTFTDEQKIKWPYWERFKCGVYILTAANQSEYDKLFQKPNFRVYWNPKWDNEADIDALIDQLALEHTACLTP